MTFPGAGVVGPGVGPSAVGVGVGAEAVSEPVGVGYVGWVDPDLIGDGTTTGEIVGSGVGDGVGPALGVTGPGVGQVTSGDSWLGPGVSSAEGEGSTGGRGHSK